MLPQFLEEQFCSSGADLMEWKAAIILIRILKNRYAVARNVWEVVVRKSRIWLADTIAHSKPNLRGKDLEAWVEAFY
jgi:hypothetical protein